MRRLRVLHIAGRLSERGGADIHMLGMIHHLSSRHLQHLLVGVVDAEATVACEVTMAAGLEAPSGEPVELTSAMDAFKPDVVHVHNVVNPAALEALAGLPVVMTVQDHRFFCPGSGKLTADGRVCRDAMSPQVCAPCFSDDDYFRRLLALTRRRLAAITDCNLTVLSHYMKQELVHAGVEASSVSVIPPFVYGLDRVSEETASDAPPCVLFSGRLVHTKGVDEAVEAWRRSGVAAPMVIAGTGSLRSRYRSRYPECELPGWVPHRELGCLYHRAEVLVFPSRWQEPFGIVGLEALSFGVPVAAWVSGGVAEWHPGPGLVPWGDVDALAAAIAELAGRSADMPAGFEPDVLTGRLERVYLATVEGRSTQGDVE